MKNKISVLLIDDEPLALKRLHRLLEKYDEFEIKGEASDGQAGLTLIELHKPDLIFLDVEMPVLNGFEMLTRLKHIPRIIFTTAFEEYAIRAFEENSIDYLLKPVDPERLDKAVEKYKRLSQQTAPDRIIIDELLKAMQHKKEVKSLPVKIGDKLILIKTENIAYLEAKDKYVFIVTDDNNEYLTDFTLASLEEKLSAPFLRIHRAYMINCDKIREVHKGFNGAFIFMMRDNKNSRITSGRTYSDAVRKMFEI